MPKPYSDGEFTWPAECFQSWLNCLPKVTSPTRLGNRQNRTVHIFVHIATLEPKSPQPRLSRPRSGPPVKMWPPPLSFIHTMLGRQFTAPNGVPAWVSLSPRTRFFLSRGKIGFRSDNGFVCERSIAQRRHCAPLECRPTLPSREHLAAFCS